MITSHYTETCRRYKQHRARHPAIFLLLTTTRSLSLSLSHPRTRTARPLPLAPQLVISLSGRSIASMGITRGENRMSIRIFVIGLPSISASCACRLTRDIGALCNQRVCSLDRVSYVMKFMEIHVGDFGSDALVRRYGSHFNRVRL